LERKGKKNNGTRFFADAKPLDTPKNRLCIVDTPVPINKHPGQVVFGRGYCFCAPFNALEWPGHAGVDKVKQTNLSSHHRNIRFSE